MAAYSATAVYTGNHRDIRTAVHIRTAVRICAGPSGYTDGRPYIQIAVRTFGRPSMCSDCCPYLRKAVRSYGQPSLYTHGHPFATGQHVAIVGTLSMAFPCAILTQWVLSSHPEAVSHPFPGPKCTTSACERDCCCRQWVQEASVG